MNEDYEMHVKVGSGKYVCVLRVGFRSSLVKVLRDEKTNWLRKEALIYRSSFQAESTAGSPPNASTRLLRNNDVTLCSWLRLSVNSSY